MLLWEGAAGCVLEQRQETEKMLFFHLGWCWLWHRQCSWATSKAETETGRESWQVVYTTHVEP